MNFSKIYFVPVCVQRRGRIEQAFGNQLIRTDEQRITCEGRVARVRRIAVTGWSKRQHLPQTLTSSDEEIDKLMKELQKDQVRKGFMNRFASTAKRFSAKLQELYGAERAAKVQYAEAFEISEYGRRPNVEEIKKLFPFFQ